MEVSACARMLVRVPQKKTNEKTEEYTNACFFIPVKK